MSDCDKDKCVTDITAVFKIIDAEKSRNIIIEIKMLAKKHSSTTNGRAIFAKWIILSYLPVLPLS